MFDWYKDQGQTTMIAHELLVYDLLLFVFASTSPMVMFD